MLEKVRQLESYGQKPVNCHDGSNEHIKISCGESGISGSGRHLFTLVFYVSKDFFDQKSDKFFKNKVTLIINNHQK